MTEKKKRPPGLGCGLTLASGLLLGLLATLDAHLGGAGTTGRGWPIVALAVCAAVGVATALLGGSG